MKTSSTEDGLVTTKEREWPTKSKQRTADYFARSYVENYTKKGIVTMHQHYKETKSKVDMVNHPPHYTYGRYEVLDVIDAFFKDNGYLWQVFKYIARAGKKGDELEDLKKAQFYLDRYIKIREEELK